MLDSIVGHYDVLVACLAPEASLVLLARCFDHGQIVVPDSYCVLLLRAKAQDRKRPQALRQRVAATSPPSTTISVAVM